MFAVAVPLQSAYVRFVNLMLDGTSALYKKPNIKTCELAVLNDLPSEKTTHMSTVCLIQVRRDIHAIEGKVSQRHVVDVACNNNQ